MQSSFAISSLQMSSVLTFGADKKGPKHRNQARQQTIHLGDFNKLSAAEQKKYRQRSHAQAEADRQSPQLTRKALREQRDAAAQAAVNAGGEPVFIVDGFKYKMTGEPGKNYILLSDPHMDLRGQIEKADTRLPFTDSLHTGTWFSGIDLVTSGQVRVQWDFKSPPKVFHVGDDPEQAPKMRDGDILDLAPKGKVQAQWNAKTKILEIKSPVSGMALKASRYGTGAAHMSDKSEFFLSSKEVGSQVHGLAGQALNPKWEKPSQTFVGRLKPDRHGRGALEIIESDGTVRTSHKGDLPFDILCGYEEKSLEQFPPGAPFSKLRAKDEEAPGTLFALA